MKVVSIVGARPQFVKASVVSRALRCGSEIREILVHTGQHYDANMSDLFFGTLGIPAPDYNLGVGSGTHGVQTARMLEGIESVLVSEKPDWALVYGDTNSTAAGALAAVKLRIPVAHVEAGLRSGNRAMPEEINRIVADQLSTLLFAPTTTAVANLEREGIHGARVAQVGDVMFDAALYFGAKAVAESSVLQRLDLVPHSYVLATIHRAENTDDPGRLRSIFEGLANVSRELAVVLPLHPRTRAALLKAGLLEQFAQRMHLTEPLGYLDMLLLEKSAAVIATDSGGVQKEAFFYRVPCCTLRTETEWTELLDAGWNVLVSPEEPNAIARSVLGRVGTRGSETAPYGTGNSADLIRAALVGA